MSRQELAEQINAHLLNTARLNADLDGNYIGKLERGVHRWPSVAYRQAFRTVLNAASDAELGFYITGRTRSSGHRPGSGPTAATTGAGLQDLHRRRDVADEAAWGATEPHLDQLGLTWYRDLRDTVSTVRDLWTADLQRRSVVVAAAWAASAFAVPARDWLIDWLDNDVAHDGGRLVGRSDVEALWQMCQVFTDADHRLGGGYARSTLDPLRHRGGPAAVGRHLPG
jgi:hypothetical protein